jgi:hypothetical protein
MCNVVKEDLSSKTTWLYTIGDHISQNNALKTSNLPKQENMLQRNK